MKSENASKRNVLCAIDVPTELVMPSECNVHDIRTDDRSFRFLVENIRNMGLIHRITVRETGDGRFTVIDGHRRLAALKELHAATIPVEVWDVPEDSAMCMTISANDQREANDALLEAEQIERIMGKGMGTAKIAAMLGWTEAHVRIRAKLINLTDDWRALSRKYSCTNDMLEHVASFDRSIQEDVASDIDIANYPEPFDGQYRWQDFSSEFESRLYRISDANFDTRECQKCPHNTATETFLFEEFEDDPQCQCAAHFIERYNGVTDKTIVGLKASGTTPIEVSSVVYIPWPRSEKRSDECTVPYVYLEGKLRKITWSKPMRDSYDGTEAMTESDRAALAEARNVKRGLRMAYGRIRSISALESASPDGADAFEKVVRTRRFQEWAIERLKNRYLMAGQTIADADIPDLIGMFGGVNAFARTFGVEFTTEELHALGTLDTGADED